MKNSKEGGHRGRIDTTRDNSEIQKRVEEYIAKKRQDAIDQIQAQRGWHSVFEPPYTPSDEEIRRMEVDLSFTSRNFE